jgi:myo-inositol-hexaphosphate 3-phosphohydrolase
MRGAVAAASLLVLAACETTPPPSPLATASVPALAETDPVASVDDAADDPAIWRNAADPAKSLVVGTDKKAGLHVFDLGGKRLSFTPSPRLNNVDLRETARGVLVAASDREDLLNARMDLYLLDIATATLKPLGRYPSGPGEAYGMCLWKRSGDGALFGFVVLKDGRIDQLAIDLSGAAPKVTKVREMKLGTQSEGCIADDRTGLLYVAEEDVGLWRFAADPSAPVTATAIAKADGKEIVMDAEGLAIAPEGTDGGWLIASSQGDNAYTVYALPGVTYAGRFRIAGAGGVDGTFETDGIELVTGDFGANYPQGLFVAQDGDNAPETQNFKYASWADVIAALKLNAK